MKARTFFTCMLLLTILTSVLLALTERNTRIKQPTQGTATGSCDDDTRLQSADGGMIWETVSRHLLSAVQ
jgi:hypothetical protein